MTARIPNGYDRLKRLEEEKRRIEEKKNIALANGITGKQIEHISNALDKLGGKP